MRRLLRSRFIRRCFADPVDGETPSASDHSAEADAGEYLTPPPMAPAKDVMGGGGGQHGPTPVTKGQLPKFADQQITPPKAPPMEQPKIKMPDPTIEVQKDLKMANNNMPMLGDPHSTLSGPMSMGSGSGTGTGRGERIGTWAGFGRQLWRRTAACWRRCFRAGADLRG